MGITPADAGKTVSSSAVGLTDRDHPRGCGENSSLTAQNRILRGSPPRMRGKLKATFARRCLGRDHPRGCGENLRYAEFMNPTGGSPPRMRGKLRSARPACFGGWITPADAGKTDTGDVRLKRAKDHPRGCGENNCSTFIEYEVSGSPPRMRGKRIDRVIHLPIRGITPADAGKTGTTECTWGEL